MLANIAKCRDIVSKHQFRRVGGVTLDVQTANLVVHVYDNLKDDNAIKFAGFTMKRQVAVAYNLVAKGVVKFA